MQRNEGGRWWGGLVEGRPPGRWLAAPLAALLLTAPGACQAPSPAPPPIPREPLLVRQSRPVPAAADGGAPESPGRPQPESAPPDRPPPPPSPDAPALLWRAGRGPLPGLSAAQSARRRGESEMALASIRAALAPGSAVAERWEDWIEALLRRPADPAWPSVVRLVGALELRRLAPLLAPSLDTSSATARRLAARLSLHALFGIWFGAPEELEPFEAALGVAAVNGATEAFVQRLLAAEERGARRLLSLIELDPTRVPPWSEVDDPLLRARIAERLGAALADGKLAPAALDSLIGALEEEQDPRAFHAQLEAVLVPLSSVADEAELERLFALFQRRVEGDWDGRSLSVALALGRLVYAQTSAGEMVWLARALDLAGRALGSALAADRQRGFEDPDAVAAVIGSLGTLAKRARALEPQAAAGEPEPPGLLARAGARQALIEILRDPLRAEATRQAAGVALGTFVRTDELDLFVTELARVDLPAGLAHVLLGTLGGLLVELSNSDEATRALPALERVAVISGSSDPDLRRSALTLLSDPRLEPFVRELDARFLLKRLQREDVAELRRSLFVLLGRFGDPSMFEPLLTLEGFERLAGEEGANAIELDGALAKLSAGSPERLHRAAARLADGAPPSNVALPRRALALVADIDEPGLAALGPEARSEMIEWVWRLHALGVPLRDGLDARVSAFVARLLAPVASVGSTAEGLDAARREHLLAVLGAQAADPGAGSQAILEHFARALALAEASEAPASFVRLVRRDRARHRLASGALAEGLADYRALFEQDPETLEVGDLRRAGRLVAEAAARSEGPGLRGSAPTSGGSAGSGGNGSLVLGSGAPPGAEEQQFAAELLFTLLERNAWASDRVAERLSDLRRLRELVLRRADPAALERFLELFTGLPTSAESDPTDVPRRWRDLVQDPAALRELLELQREVRERLESVGEPEAPGE